MKACGSLITLKFYVTWLRLTKDHNQMMIDDGTQTDVWILSNASTETNKREEKEPLLRYCIWRPYQLCIPVLREGI